MPHQFVHNLYGARLDDLFVVVGLELFRDPSCEMGLVVFFFIEANRACSYRTLHQAAHHRYDG